MTEDKAAAETKCIFCEIAKGNINPLGEGTIYEDDNYMAWLSPFPNTEGFSVVIPKKHYDSDVLAMPEEDLKDFVVAAKKVSNILLNYFDDVGRVGLVMEGTGVNHAHVKLFPMHGTEHMKQGIWKQYASQRHEFFEKYEGFIMSNDGPQADFEKLKMMASQIKNNQ